MPGDFPILDFDPTRKAVIEPTVDVGDAKAPPHCVLCFHREVVDQVRHEHKATLVKELDWESGPHTVWQMDFNGRKLAFLQPGVGK